MGNTSSWSIALPAVSTLISVGARVATTPGEPAALDPARPRKGASRAARARALPVPWAVRKTLLNSLVLPAALTGARSPASPPPLWAASAPQSPRTCGAVEISGACSRPHCAGPGPPA